MSQIRKSPDPRFGSWKFIHEVNLDDMKAHPIWLWCMALDLKDDEDGPIGGDETSMRPLLNSNDVPLEHHLEPLVLLQIQETDMFASGLYDHESKLVKAITIFTKEGSSAPKRVAGLPTKPIYAAVPRIDGKSDCHFQAIDNTSDEATLVNR